MPAWVPVGITGVIRGAARNSDVFTDRAMELLAIPKEVFLERWHFTYDRQAFAALFRGPRSGTGRRVSEDQARAGSAVLAGQSKSIRSARHQKA